MRFKLTLTNEDGVVLDSFSLYNLTEPHGKTGNTESFENEDCELVGRPFANQSLCERLASEMRKALK